MSRVVFLAASVLLLAAQSAWACATASPEGRDVRVAQEEVIIVWDSKRKVQHFIRRAAFSTQAQDFGFIVPTPTKPELHEASNEVFQRLHKAIRPKTVVRTSYRPTLFCLNMFTVGSDQAMEEAGSVRVLDSKRVAGYDAVVLEADSAQDLLDWLKKHHYHARPALKSWLAKYIDAGWKITAFKFAGDDKTKTKTKTRTKTEAGTKTEAKTQPDPVQPGQDRDVTTSTVRMTFPAKTPFFPYREPKDVRDRPDPRSLRVFFIADRKYQAHIGWDEKAWPSLLQYAGEPDDLSELLDGAVPSDALPESATWLTVFLDSSGPRDGTDELYFTPDEDDSTYEPVEYDVNEVVIPLDCILAPLLVIGFILFVGYRRKSRAEML